MIIPQKIKLAQLPTPLVEHQFDGCKFYLKRDDLTGLELSGNKVRKLEYLLADAQKQNTDLLLTVGGKQSNHCRATAIAASSLGIKSKLYLWGEETNEPEGNLFLNSLLDNEIQMISKEQFVNANQIMFSDKEQFEREGKSVYLVPEGGTSSLGIWGYISFFDELSKQVDLKQIKGIAVAAGSGGTAAGLLLGAAINNFDIKIYAFNVLYEKSTLLSKITTVAEECIEKYQIEAPVNFDNLEIVSGYMGADYHSPTNESLEIAKRFFQQSTILFDPVYTAKAFHGYYETFLKGNDNSDILFLHTGGLFGAFDKKRLAYL